jgi:O-antigen ligase
VNASWFSPVTIAGVFGAALFAVLCYTNMRRAILVFTALGCIRSVQIGAFSGSEMVQGLLPVELLATVLIGVWLLRSAGRGPSRWSAPLNVPLLLLIPCSFISLLVGFTWFDPTVAVDHMKVTVSIGQIMIAVWAIGTYVVVADSVRDDATIVAVRNLIIALALPSLALLVAPEAAWPYVGWSTTFALPASSICLALFFDSRSFVRRLGLLAIAIAPSIYGFAMGKAFFYGYVVVSMGAIGWFKARRVALIGLPFAFAVYVVAVPLASGSLTPGFMREAVETEEAQQSLGGGAGRDQLIKDSLTIWAKYPVFGVGPGNNYPYMLRYSSLGTAHNQYMNILIELGLVGLVCFLAFAVRALMTGLALWRTVRNPVHRTMVLSWIGVFAGFLAGGMFGDFMIPSIRNGGLELFALFYVQWILLGIVVSIRNTQRGLVPQTGLL